MLSLVVSYEVANVADIEKADSVDLVTDLRNIISSIPLVIRSQHGEVCEWKRQTRMM